MNIGIHTNLPKVLKADTDFVLTVTAQAFGLPEPQMSAAVIIRSKLFLAEQMDGGFIVLRDNGTASTRFKLRIYVKKQVGDVSIALIDPRPASMQKLGELTLIGITVNKKGR